MISRSHTRKNRTGLSLARSCSTDWRQRASAGARGGSGRKVGSETARGIKAVPKVGWGGGK